MNSPAEIVAAWPTTVITSRLPRAFTRKTQKPFSSLWKVTRSTSPAKTSVLLSAVVFKLIRRFSELGASSRSYSSQSEGAVKDQDAIRFVARQIGSNYLLSCC